MLNFHYSKNKAKYNIQKEREVNDPIGWGALGKHLWDFTIIIIGKWQKQHKNYKVERETDDPIAKGEERWCTIKDDAWTRP